MSRITIIGAAGRTGRHVVRALSRRDADVWALVHRPAQEAIALEDGAAGAIVADLADVAALRKAFAGTDLIHFIPPPLNPSEERYAQHAIEAAQDAGVKRFVFHSVLHPCTPDMPHHRRKARIETMLRDSRLAWTILQPAMYAQTVQLYLPTPDRLVVPFDATRRFNLVHVGDLAEAASIVMTQAGHEYATYELAGPEALDFNDIAVAISEIIGRKVAVHVAAAAEMSFPAAMPRYMLAEAFAMFAHYDGHGLRGNPNVLRQLLGREPTAFAAAIRPLVAGLSRST